MLLSEICRKRSTVLLKIFPSDNRNCIKSIYLRGLFSSYFIRNFQLKGTIDDCSCNVDTVDYFNNVKIYPRLKSLLSNNYFRYYKVNLKRECPFWADDSHCTMKFCHVKACDQNDIPSGLKGDVFPHTKYIEEVQKIQGCSEDLDEELSFLNTSISEKKHQEFQKWTEHDDTKDNFCILDDNENEAEYVDLLLNPERYTGYRGKSAQRIWESIYLENCFKSQSPVKSKKSSFQALIGTSSLNDVCLEERVFYRMVSGLHSSINTHLCSLYLLSEKNAPVGFGTPTGVWGPNVDEFKRRFSPESTNNEGPNWLRNLYFAYIVELRAISKIAPYLRQEKFYTGYTAEDNEVQLAINDILNVIESFPTHFDEHMLFKGASVKLKNEFREKFRNISRIMDCVGCDKCRLWGKLQTQGMGTALKILFSGNFEYNLQENTHMLVDKNGGQIKFKLTRTEIVALFNAFGRYVNFFLFHFPFDFNIRC